MAITTPHALILEDAVLAKMDPVQLFHLLDALQTIDNVLDGLLAQERFSRAPGQFNEAGRVLSSLSDWLIEAKESVVAGARKRPEKQSKSDALWLGWVKVHYEAAFLESLSGLGVVVSAAAHAVEEAQNG